MRRPAGSFQRGALWLERCHAEVGYFDIVLVVQEQVLWLQVSMAEKSKKRHFYVIRSLKMTK